MVRRLIASLSKCDMCRKRESELWRVRGFDLCSHCKSTMERCDNQKGSGNPKNVPGCFEYNRGRRAR